MALPQYIARDYSGGVVEGVQLTAAIGPSDTTCTIANTTGWVNAANNPLGTIGPFSIVVDLNTPTAEKILCQSVNLTSGLVTFWPGGRGYDQTTAKAHVPGGSEVGVVPCWTAVEAAEANAASVYGPGGGGAIVGLTGNPSGLAYPTTVTSITNEGIVPIQHLSTGGLGYLKGGMTLNTGSNTLDLPVSGIYQLTAQISWSNNNTASYETFILYNGTQYPGTFAGGWFTGNPQAVVRANVLTEQRIEANAGDAIGFGAYQTTGGTISYDSGTLANTFLAVELISK